MEELEEMDKMNKTNLIRNSEFFISSNYGYDSGLNYLCNLLYILEKLIS